MFLTPGAQLRSIYLPSQSSRKDQSYLQYIQLLKSKGIQINPKLFPSYFRLKNGLQYPGIATSQKVLQNQMLVRVPKNLILSSFICLEREQLKQIYHTQQFYHDPWSWQDRILITYLLYIYSIKQQSNIWYHMITHLSKDIDILGFWSQEDLDKFKDLTVKSAAQQDKESFQQEWKLFEKVKEKYEILQNQEIFNKYNYQWIFIHIASRCFGKSLEFTSMAPFCEFVNHHCCNGHYDIQKIQQSKQQQNKQKQQTNQTRKFQQQQQHPDNLSQLTSQGSYLSQDYIQVGQFAYDQIQSTPLKWTCTQSFSLIPKQKFLIQQLKSSNLHKLQQQLKWDDFTILFVPYLIQMNNLIQNQYIAGRKQFEKAYNDLKLLQECVQYYKQKIEQCYKIWRKKEYNKLVNPIQKQQNKKQTKSHHQQFPTQQLNHYTNFILTTGSKDSYYPNNQVYFCYGRNSNRTLLLRYGFALQGNKYQHVWLSFQIIQILKQFPDTLNKLQQKSLSLRRKFKIKYGRVNMELIMFFRLNSWRFYGKKTIQDLFNINKEYYKEIAILSQIKDNLQFRLQQFQSDNQYDLKNQKLSYHQYFITLYHQEKVKILKQHIQFINELIKFNQLLENRQTLQKAKSMFTPKQLYIYRHYIAQYQ